MSIVIKGKEKFIIDRTLINIIQKSICENMLLEDGLQEFIINLTKIGVDFFEVDEATFNYVSPLMFPTVFIFRIEKTSQLKICSKSGIEYIIVKEEDYSLVKNYSIKENYNFKIILEVDIEPNTSNYIKDINENIDINELFCLRIRGERDWSYDNYSCWDFDIKMNMYASDEFNMATAVGFQAVISGFDYVDTSFCGYDEVYGTTALEELLVAIKIIVGAQVNGDISLLREITKQYEKITCTKVPSNKPVVGNNIFKYESGVHVAGIEKNPMTYEPFNPEIVGMQRKLALGKHSGHNSITSKLKELGINNKFTDAQIAMILEEIKNKSIANKTELCDKDFMEICERIKDEKLCSRLLIQL